MLNGCSDSSIKPRDNRSNFFLDLFFAFAGFEENLLVIEASLVLHVIPRKENASGKATSARDIGVSCDEMAQSLEAKIVVLGSQGVGKTSLVQFVTVLTFEGRGC
jgi:hypothetical protein